MGYSRLLEPKDLALILDRWSTAFCSVLPYTPIYTKFISWISRTRLFGCFAFLTDLSCYAFLRAFSFCLSHLRTDPCAEGSIGQEVWRNKPIVLFWLKYSFYSFFAMIVLQIPRTQLAPTSPVLLPICLITRNGSNARFLQETI